MDRGTVQLRGRGAPQLLGCQRGDAAKPIMGFRDAGSRFFPCPTPRGDTEPRKKTLCRNFRIIGPRNVTI